MMMNELAGYNIQAIAEFLNPWEKYQFAITCKRNYKASGHKKGDLVKFYMEPQDPETHLQIIASLLVALQSELPKRLHNKFNQQLNDMLDRMSQEGYDEEYMRNDICPFPRVIDVNFQSFYKNGFEHNPGTLGDENGSDVLSALSNKIKSLTNPHLDLKGFRDLLLDKWGWQAYNDYKKHIPDIKYVEAMMPICNQSNKYLLHYFYLQIELYVVLDDKINNRCKSCNTWYPPGEFDRHDIMKRIPREHVCNIYYDNLPDKCQRCLDGDSGNESD